MPHTTAAPVELPAFLEAWSFAPAPAEDFLSFSTGSDVGAPLSTWRVDLPSGDDADRALDLAEQRLRHSEAALDSVPDRLDEVLLAAQSGSVSYSVSASPAARELLELLDQPIVTSYGLFSSRPAEGEDAGRGLVQILHNLGVMLSRMALVETSIGGRWVGSTWVGWSGGFESAFPTRVAPADAGRHRRQVNQALASRRLAIAMIARTAQGAVKVSALLAAPGGVLLVLPAVWKFVNSTLSDIRNYQEIQSQGE